MTNNKTINLLKDMLDITLNLPLFYIEDIKNNLEEIMKYLKSNKIVYNKIFSERPTLNDVFLELTGKELRD